MAEDGSLVIAGDTFDDWGAASAGGRDFMAAKYVGIRMGEKGESTVDHVLAEDLGQRAVETNQCPFNAKYFPCSAANSFASPYLSLAPTRLDSDGTLVWKWQVS